MRVRLEFTCLACVSGLATWWLLQFRSYLVRSGDSSPKFGVEDIYDALSSAAVINIHAYGESGDAQLEVNAGTRLGGGQEGTDTGVVV